MTKNDNREEIFVHIPTPRIGNDIEDVRRAIRYVDNVLDVCAWRAPNLYGVLNIVVFHMPGTDPSDDVNRALYKILPMPVTPAVLFLEDPF